ncbi:MAG: hypothetical protein CVU14_04650 [Bacteroidetes bacterium HGW-Bacteroidetes-9]|jgi:S1-C subfamily serine protease|nr:MAG: hypothetical protein CVU14_04650 [Bacteroidetes bacterium HGW-Bacteroidetes-9]
MKIKYYLLNVLLVMVYQISEVIAQSSDRESAQTSVVKVKTSFIKVSNGKKVKEIGTASGWCWKEPTLVVTALHAVAGADEITIHRDNNSSTKASIERVLKEADLALLRLNSDIGLRPLNLQDADPNSGMEYYVWGFPQGVFSMQGDDIRFSRSLEQSPTLNSILTGNSLKSELITQGYPLPVARIYRISSTIQPGHSGAPIMAKNGVVIGIADGGLRGGAARINWAMPAAYYVPRLISSNDQIPRSPSVQTSLYSSLTTVDLDATEQEELEKVKSEASENKVVNGTQSVSKTWTASYNDILETMDYEGQRELNELTALFNIDMSGKSFDIYEDFNTGATFAIPGGENLQIHDGSWFNASNSDETLQYFASSYVTSGTEESILTVTGILEAIFPSDTWSPVVEEEFGWTSIDEYFHIFSGNFIDSNQNFASVDAEVDGEYLLIVFTLHNEQRLEYDDDYLKQYLHYSIGMQMSAFSEN